MVRQGFAFVLALLGRGQLAPQESNQGGVTVAVTPAEVAAGAKVWSFKVVLDTHSQDLSDDLANSAVLVDGQAAKASRSRGKARRPAAITARAS